MAINVMGTLKAMPIGWEHARVFLFSETRGTSLRNTASSLTELGMLFHINKTAEGYRVWRER